MGLVTFDDTSSNNVVTVNQDVAPGVLQYPKLAIDERLQDHRDGLLTKRGSASLLLGSSGVNDFSGGVPCSAERCRW
jgi:hypothetical protein